VRLDSVGKVFSSGFSEDKPTIVGRMSMSASAVLGWPARLRHRATGDLAQFGHERAEGFADSARLGGDPPTRQGADRAIVL
jgi:hypothetical protein